MKVRAAIAASALGLGFAVSACGGGSSADVKVTLKEFSVSPDKREHKGGTVEVEAKNAGSIKHELVMVKAKDVAALPVKPDGSVDEDKIADADKVGEIGEFAAGKSETHKFKLAAGDYVMFCNIVNEKSGAPPVVHFKEGMHETFTAT